MMDGLLNDDEPSLRFEAGSPSPKSIVSAELYSSIRNESC